MPIQVNTENGPYRFTDATSWSSGGGHLFVMDDDNDLVAEFARHCWSSVAVVNDDAAPTA